ncbi:MAG: hypothetical protein KAI70_00640 [Candidatus Omnitrophica bacterium]|nr:hypothetical protein [Candidatus Omnitrophota bacterium]
MDFSVTTSENGVPVMSWDKPGNISTNVFLSLSINKGKLFSAPSFGLDFSGIKKVASTNINLIKARTEKALQWLVDIGKAKSIFVIVEGDSKDKTRVNFKVEVIQADGIPVTIDYFRTVGGPSDDFTI